MNKKLVFRILIAFVLGIAIGVGLWLSKVDTETFVTWVSPFGDVLVAMLKMIVIPVIFLSLIAGAASLPTSQFGKIGIKVILWYFGTSLLAAVVGSFLATWFNPGGSAADIAAWQNVIETKSIEAVTPADSSLVDVVVGMFQNPFEALSSGNFLAIIVFAIALGVALKIVHDSSADESRIKRGVGLFLDVIEGVKEAIFKMVDWILLYSPIGVFALTAVNFAQYGSHLFGPYAMLATGVIVGVFVMMFVVYPLLMFVFVRKNPFKFLFRIKEPMLTAFVTRSSAASLPVSLTVAEDELKVDNSLTSFALPLGATINMDGVCVHLPMFAVLAANMFGADVSFGSLAILVITTVLASVGAGGVPGGSLMLLFIILQNMGLAAEHIGIIVGLALGINPILDMFETMNNVTGDLVCTYTVAEMTDMVGKDD